MTDDARKAAEERYPDSEGWPQSWQHLFVEGAEWQAARTSQITDAQYSRIMGHLDGLRLALEAALRAATEATKGEGGNDDSTGD